MNKINLSSSQTSIPSNHLLFPQALQSLDTISFEYQQETNNNLFQPNYADTYLEDISKPAYSSKLLVYTDNSSAYEYEPQDYSSKFSPVPDSCAENSDNTNSTCMAPAIQPTSSISNMMCPVCELETSGAHTYIDCFRYVHIICGRSIGEEGYSSSIVCNKCDLKRNQNDPEAMRHKLKKKTNPVTSAYVKIKY